MDKQEFYIGWQANAPSSFVKHIRKVLTFVFPIALVTALLIASFQKKFSASNFEFGQLTEVKGIYFNKPVPMIKVVAGKDIWGNTSYLTIPLVGYGKHGAETAIMEIEKEKNISLDKRYITLKGTLLYSDGKTLLQVNKEDNPVVSIGKEADAALLPQQKELGNQLIKGEIIDPKCYFGVMKPGEGKVHRDCAIRCILGGIPPVFKVLNEKGEANFYLIVGADGERLNNLVQDYVAEPVAINARVVQQDDWIILYVNNKNGISKIPGIEIVRPGLVAIACSSNCCK